MTLHKLRATLPSAPVTLPLPSTVSSQIHFIGRPFVRLRVLLFLTSLDWSFSKESMPVTVLAVRILLRLLYVCWRPSGSVLLVFSSGNQHVILTAVLTGDEGQSLYLQQF
jgi:hypothetical protein